MRDALRAAGGFRSAQDVYATLRAQGEPVGLSTIYRHLQAFADDGVVDVIHTADGEATYRYCGETAAEHHHHHLVCRSCGATIEVGDHEVEEWATEVAAKHGFSDVSHTIEIFGTCSDCGRR